MREAVVLSQGQDACTGESQDGHLISPYDHEASKQGCHGCKADFAMLPTGDHVDAAAVAADSRIRAWKTNDAKNDLLIKDFLGLCELLLIHEGYSVVNRVETCREAFQKKSPTA